MLRVDVMVYTCLSPPAQEQPPPLPLLFQIRRKEWGVGCRDPRPLLSGTYTVDAANKGTKFLGGR